MLNLDYSAFRSAHKGQLGIKGCRGYHVLLDAMFENKDPRYLGCAVCLTLYYQLPPFEETRVHNGTPVTFYAFAQRSMIHEADKDIQELIGSWTELPLCDQEPTPSPLKPKALEFTPDKVKESAPTQEAISSKPDSSSPPTENGGSECSNGADDDKSEIVQVKYESSIADFCKSVPGQKHQLSSVGLGCLGKKWVAAVSEGDMKHGDGFKARHPENMA